MFIKPSILALVLGRDRSLFADAVEAARTGLCDAIGGARILVIGAGGSIGSAFVKVLASYGPAALHLVDLSENALVRLVRDLHADGLLRTRQFHTYAIGFDEPEFVAFLRDQGPFDFIFNFAALKHVRSERDPYTLMRLLQVNVVANHELLKRLADAPPRRFFCVSSDKAVNPASLMGASKAFMERVCLAHSGVVPFSSARFANVAFSEGSLPQSFLLRLEAGQPLAGPSDVRRYFISEREAGELCLLAGFLGGDGEIFTPELRPDKDLRTFAEIAGLILQERGLKPVWCDSAEEALQLAQRRRPGETGYPCYFAASNTSGEKAFEEFQGTGERVAPGRLANITIVTEPRRTAIDVVQTALDDLARLRRAGTWDKSRLIALVRSVVPEFEHLESEANLDQKL